MKKQVKIKKKNVKTKIDKNVYHLVKVLDGWREFEMDFSF